MTDSSSKENIINFSDKDEQAASQYFGTSARQSYLGTTSFLQANGGRNRKAHYLSGPIRCTKLSVQISVVSV